MAITPDETLALYRTFDTPTLVQLRHAFIVDRDTPNADLVTVAFARGRLAVIDEVLKERA